MKKLIFLFAILLSSCYEYEILPSEKRSKTKEQVPDVVKVEADTVRRRCGV